MERFTLPVVAHVFLLRPGLVLLARRHGTGFEDGNYGPVGGHLDGGESVRQAAARECREEVGVEIDPADLDPIGVVHFDSPTGEGIDFFFTTTRWRGDPRPIADCDALDWFPLDALPDGTIPFVRHALAHHLQAGWWFDEDGWETR